jgi:hypothetical protein
MGNKAKPGEGMIERHAASGGAGHRAVWRAVVDPARATGTGVNRASGTIWCAERGSWAVVTVIERRTSSGSHRYVQWCSLLGLDVQCKQACLESFEGVPDHLERD